MNNWGYIDRTVKCHSYVKKILNANVIVEIASEYAGCFIAARRLREVKNRWRCGSGISVNEGKGPKAPPAGGYWLCLWLRIRIHIFPLISLFFRERTLGFYFALTAHLDWIVIMTPLTSTWFSRSRTAFERNKTDVFRIKTHNVGPIKKLRYSAPSGCMAWI